MNVNVDELKKKKKEKKTWKLFNFNCLKVLLLWLYSAEVPHHVLFSPLMHQEHVVIHDNRSDEGRRELTSELNETD